MKKLMFLIITLVSARFAHADIVREADTAQRCYLYQGAVRDEKGQIKISEGQTVFSNNDIYGFSLENMTVDFKSQLVYVDVVQNIIWGFDKPLLPARIAINPKNEQFNFLINQLNRSIMLFEKVCITGNNELIYAKFFPQKDMPQEGKE